MPSIFKRTYWSVPIPAVAFSSLFLLLALLSTTEQSNIVFHDLVSLATVFGLFNWMSVLISYISLRRGMEAQNIPRNAMPFKEHWMKARAWVTLISVATIILFSGNLLPSAYHKYQPFRRLTICRRRSKFHPKIPGQDLRVCLHRYSHPSDIHIWLEALTAL